MSMEAHHLLEHIREVEKACSYFLERCRVIREWIDSDGEEEDGDVKVLSACRHCPAEPLYRTARPTQAGDDPIDAPAHHKRCSSVAPSQEAEPFPYGAPWAGD